MQINGKQIVHDVLEARVVAAANLIYAGAYHLLQFVCIVTVGVDGHWPVDKKNYGIRNIKYKGIFDNLTLSDGGAASYLFRLKSVDRSINRSSNQSILINEVPTEEALERAPLARLQRHVLRRRRDLGGAVGRQAAAAGRRRHRQQAQAAARLVRVLRVVIFYFSGPFGSRYLTKNVLQ